MKKQLTWGFLLAALLTNAIRIDGRFYINRFYIWTYGITFGGITHLLLRYNSVYFYPRPNKQTNKKKVIFHFYHAKQISKINTKLSEYRICSYWHGNYDGDGISLMSSNSKVYFTDTELFHNYKKFIFQRQSSWNYVTTKQIW